MVYNYIIQTCVELAKHVARTSLVFSNVKISFGVSEYVVLDVCFLNLFLLFLHRRCLGFAFTPGWVAGLLYEPCWSLRMCKWEKNFSRKILQTVCVHRRTGSNCWSALTSAGKTGATETSFPQRRATLLNRGSIS